ncbi:DUF92 domain-containing protein [Paenibacillus sp. NPDC058071]|uniref:DUF92 domain-containing protein n=1 Tax=Paenibacillus sp. NPDC058071 TaxID=3346326 RepID=UPI0036DA686C
MVGIIDEWWLRLLIGVIGAGLAAAAAYRARALSGSGALSALAMGAGFIALGEPIWFACLIAFFISSTAWSKYKKRHRAKAQAEANYEKTGRRDAGQVWANGGIGLALCAADAIWPSAGWLYAFIGVMGAVNADTWATEIGALSRSAPRSLLSGKKVAAGTSGAVTALGSAAAFAGAAFIGLVAAWLWPTETTSASAAAVAVVAALAGFAGCYADSLLGATVQAMYRCPKCGAETERTVHCGTKTVPLRGIAWMNNDRVNMLSSLAAGAIGWALGLLLIG